MIMGNGKRVKGVTSFALKTLILLESKDALATLPEGKLLINTINAHSYNTAQKDCLFAEALTKGDVLIPDGVSIVKACKWLKAKSQPKERIAGWDLFEFEMKRLAKESRLCSDKEKKKKKVMFLGSSEKTLALIRKNAAVDYPDLDIATYTPPYKQDFSKEENDAMVKAVNEADPDLLWIGMTAPKQEKWAYSHWQELNIHCHCGTVGAVFDFYAGTAKRAPQWWQKNGLEWLYRLILEPRRMWRRYVIGNFRFLYIIGREKFENLQ